MTRLGKIPCFNSCNLVRFGMRIFKDVLVVHDCHKQDGVLLFENQFISCCIAKTIFMLGKNDFEQVDRLALNVGLAARQKETQSSSSSYSRIHV